MFLLTGDWHLTDRPEDEYRWQVFQRVREVLTQHHVSQVFVLGDFVDRKDRHSAVFVNRLLGELQGLPITILRGNHDTCLRPPAYFEFWPSYVSQPTRFGEANLLLLPFTPNPVEEWRDLNLSHYQALFMHVTYPGALSENGQTLEGTKIPLVRPHVRIFSGDVHTPQRFGNFIHVGSPHPVKFGDSYPCRMLLVDEHTFDIVREIKLSPPQRLVVEITSAADLEKLRVNPGDAVKIRLTRTPSDIDGAAQLEAQFAAYLESRGATLAATEVIVNSTYNRDIDLALTPQATLRNFAAHEHLSQELLELGLELLQEAQ